MPEMLQEVVDLITEKELRLRTPLEELDLLLIGSKPAEALEAASSDLQIDNIDVLQLKSE